MPKSAKKTVKTFRKSKKTPKSDPKVRKAVLKGLSEQEKPWNGRPNAIDTLVLQLLTNAFSIGCSDVEACSHANIAPATLYNFQKKNPAFLEYKNQLKQNPIYKARSCVVGALDVNPDIAFKFLERKRRTEFGSGQSFDGSEAGGFLQINIIAPEGAVNVSNGNGSGNGNSAGPRPGSDPEAVSGPPAFNITTGH